MEKHINNQLVMLQQKGDRLARKLQLRIARDKVLTVHITRSAIIALITVHFLSIVYTCVNVQENCWLYNKKCTVYK